MDWPVALAGIGLNLGIFWYLLVTKQVSTGSAYPATRGPHLRGEGKSRSCLFVSLFKAMSGGIPCENGGAVNYPIPPYLLPEGREYQTRPIDWVRKSEGKLKIYIMWRIG
jgi:hypothetical protein